jgi:tRNA(Ser,Leu) C12 N-acetylase TAN1
MINESMLENEISYPDIMEYVEYCIFEIEAENIDNANKSFLKFQLSLGKIYELEDEVETDLVTENDEDRYISHGLEQDWDTYYFLRD